MTAKLSKQERDAIVVSCRETWDGGYDADAAGQYCRVKELCDTADALEADAERLREENLMLRKVAAFVPAKVYIAASERAGYGTIIKPR